MLGVSNGQIADAIHMHLELGAALYRAGAGRHAGHDDVAGLDSRDIVANEQAPVPDGIRNLASYESAAADAGTARESACS